MTKTLLTGCLVLLSILVIVEINTRCTKEEPVQYQNIDSLLYIIDSLRIHQDTIVKEIHMSDTVIKHVKDRFVMDSTTIANQSIYEDCKFFEDFVSSYNE